MANKNSSKGVAKASLKIFKYIVIVLVVVVFVAIAFNFGTAVFSNDGVERAPGTDMTVSVEKGTTIDQLGEMLEEYNIIGNKNVFKVQAWLYGVDEVKPGTYVFNNSKGGEEIFKTINAGPQSDKKKNGEEETIE